MKVFISWSGAHSRQVALILRDWLPQVINAIEPYVSSEDIDKGVRWSADVATNLESTSVGIICVTRENFKTPWINFEAGALSKAVDSSKVIPFLIDLPATDVTGPLLQFQAVLPEKKDILKLLTTINKSADIPLTAERLVRALDKWWDELKSGLDQISIGGTQEPQRQQYEMLEELLEIARVLQRSVSSQPTPLTIVRLKADMDDVELELVRTIEREGGIVSSINRSARHVSIYKKSTATDRRAIDALIGNYSYKPRWVKPPEERLST